MKSKKFVCILLSVGMVFGLYGTMFGQAGVVHNIYVGVYGPTGSVSMGTNNPANYMNITAYLMNKTTQGKQWLGPADKNIEWFGADGSFPAYVLWDVGSGWDWAIDDHVMVVVESVNGVGGWVGKNYTASSDMILTADVPDILPDTTMQLIPKPTVVSVTPGVGSYTIRWTGLQNAAGNATLLIATYAVYRSDTIYGTYTYVQDSNVHLPGVDVDSVGNSPNANAGNHFRIAVNYIFNETTMSTHRTLGLSDPSNTAPVLGWLGTGAYAADGLDNETGTTSSQYTFKVRYIDLDNDPPCQVRTLLRKGGGAPSTYAMTAGSWVAAVNDYTAGRDYYVTTPIAISGNDYQYSFNATDCAVGAGGAPTSWTDAPDVSGPPFIQAYQPGGTPSQSSQKGAIVPVTWYASDDQPLPANPINISFGNPGNWTVIASNEANDGLYNWDTTLIPCPYSYYIYLSVYDSSGFTTFDQGNFSFMITCPGVDPPPTLTVTDPGSSAGEIYTQGATISVTWVANDNIALPANPINISYGNPGNWTVIASDEPNDGTYSWDTTTIPCGYSYYMNLTVYDSIGQTTYDLSDYDFALNCPGVNNPPIINVWQPGADSGESYDVGTAITVTWMASDDNPLPTNPINISYGNPGNWISIATNQANGGSYLWDTTGVTCGASYWMNLTVYDTGGLKKYDLSNYSFQIACLANTGTIVGKVIDESGDPIQSALVILTNATGAEIGTTYTNASGNFSFTNVPAGTGYNVTISKLLYTSKVVSDITVTAGQTTDLASITLLSSMTATITGNITADGAALEGAKVELLDSSDAVLQTTYSILNGLYIFVGVNAGTYTVRASMSGYETEEKSATVSAGQIKWLDIELKKKTAADMLWLWILIIIIIVIIIIIALILLMRRKPAEELVEPAVLEEEAPGEEAPAKEPGAEGEAAPEETVEEPIEEEGDISPP